MSLTHITSHSIRRLLTLTEKKEQLIKGIEEVENEIAKALKGAATSVVEAAEAVTPFKPAKKSKGKKAHKAKAAKSKVTKSGGLKERILALLHDAGDQGLKVKEIAEKLAAKPGNISVWFSTTGKKLVTKVEPGRFAVKGSKPTSASTQTVTGYLKPPASMKAELTRAAKKPSAKPAPVTAVAKKPAKAKKKRALTAEGRAKLSANMKARWAAKRAGKPAAKAGKPAKKGFKLAKAGKNPF
ncbi:MAG: hypothetical protein NTV93_20725 [Verrucomicrobia bacterium]|nr:hypothetical protein [Verrucomicrobiota bacterium]